MYKLLLILIFIFSFQTFTRANDIRDFEIEGMGVGDSLLDFMTESEIIKAKSNSTPMGSDYLIIYYYYLPNGPELYDYVTVSFNKNDKKYIIESIAGNLIFDNDIKSCEIKKKKIINELELIFKDIATSNRENEVHPLDKSGKTFFSSYDVNFKSGAWATVGCTDWSKEMTKQKGWQDHLDVNVNSINYTNFLRKFYK